MKSTIYLVLKISFIFFIILFIANISIILFKGIIFSEKIFPRANLRFLPEQYQIYYQNTFNFKKDKSYNAIIGDSHAFGLGDGFYNPENKKFSLAHFLKDKVQNENFVSFGLPGEGTLEPFYFFDKINNSNIHSLGEVDKIFYFFYEGNDMEDNIRKKFDLKKFEKNFTLDSFFPIVRISKNIYNHFSKKNKTTEGKTLNLNTYLVNSSLKRIQTTLQSPPFELTKNELENSFDKIFKTLTKYKKFTKKIYIIYIPSPATVLDLKDPITVQSYFPKRNIDNKLTKEVIINSNNIIVKTMELYCEENDFEFYDLTNKLIEYSKINISYGPKDFKHPNKNVYNYIAKLINDEFFIYD